MNQTRQPDSNRVAPVRKAVFPVAGLGTRFLPATKSMPKEMLAVVDKPIIQYAVEEAIAAGMTELIFVTNDNKRAVEDYFDSHFELETRLEAQGKHELLKKVRAVRTAGVSYIYVRQTEPLGLGHAVLCAKPVVGNEPFAVLLADDLLDAEPSCLAQMLAVRRQTGGSMVAVESIAAGDSAQYGVIASAEKLNETKRAVAINGIVEKPKPELAPSAWGVVGRYVLAPEIFAALEALSPGVGGEVQLTDAIKTLIPYGVRACRFDGRRYDCGGRFGYLQATVEYGLRHPQAGKAFREYLNKKLATDARP